MIYRKIYKQNGETKEITYEDALNTVLGSYKDTKEVRALLNENNTIPCMFSYIEVIDQR